MYKNAGKRAKFLKKDIIPPTAICTFGERNCTGDLLSVNDMPDLLTGEAVEDVGNNIEFYIKAVPVGTDSEVSFHARVAESNITWTN